MTAVAEQAILTRARGLRHPRAAVPRRPGPGRLPIGVGRQEAPAAVMPGAVQLGPGPRLCALGGDGVRDRGALEIFGIGPAVVPVDADSYRTKAAQEAAKEARAAGQVPLLPSEVEAVTAMAGAVRAHPIAGPLLDPQRGGKPEQSLFWVDDLTGVWRRSRLDWLPDHTRARPDGHRRLQDLPAADRAPSPAPSTTSATTCRPPSTATASAARPGRRPGVRLRVPGDQPAVPGHRRRARRHARRAAREANRVAIERYRDCTEAGVWPGYSDDDRTHQPPSWVLSRPMGEL